MRGFILVLFALGLHSIVCSSCERYTGNVCDRYERRGVPKQYHIPSGKTQQQMDKEIIDAVQEHPFKYIACKDYILYLMCITKFFSCHGGKKQKKPLCKPSCMEAKESICFVDLVKDSKLYRWYKNNFHCENFNQMDCVDYYGYKDDKTIKEYSCKMETQMQQKDAKYLEVSMVTLNTPTAKVNLQYLRECLPNYLSNDSVCFHHQNRTLSSIVEGDIQKLNNLVVDRITSRLINDYCYSHSTKTTIVPLAVLHKYKPALGIAVFKDVKVVVIQRENEQAFLVIIGRNNLCLDIGNFYYSILQNHNAESTKELQNQHNKYTRTLPNKNKGSTEKSLNDHMKITKDLQNHHKESIVVYRGISPEKIQWKWIEQTENYPGGDNDNVKQFMLRMGFPMSLNLSQPTKIMQWNQESCYKLFKDENTSFVAHFNDFERQYIIKDVYTEILIGGSGRNKSTIFYLAITSDVTLSRTLKIIMNPNHFHYQKSLMLDLKSYERYLRFHRAEYVLLMKNEDLKPPTTIDFQRMQSLIELHRKDAIVVKLFGKLLRKSTLKPSWMDPVGCILTYKLTKENKEEFCLEFSADYTEKDCTRKKKQDWSAFEKLLRKVDYYQSLCGYKGIKRSEKTVNQCTVCCNHGDVFTLKSIKVTKITAHFMMVTASITFVVLNQDVEITFKVENCNLAFMLSSYIKIDGGIGKHYLYKNKKNG